MKNHISSSDNGIGAETEHSRSCTDDIPVAMSRSRFNRAVRRILVAAGAGVIVFGAGVQTAGCEGCEPEGTIHPDKSEKPSDTRRSDDESPGAHSKDDPTGPKPSSVKDHMDEQKRSSPYYNRQIR